MVYFICENTKTNESLFQCEIFWEENWSSRHNSYQWNIDLYTRTNGSNLILYVDKQHYSKDKLEELANDIKELTNLRGWLWEQNNFNNEINKEDPNNPKSKELYDVVVNHCEQAIRDFAEKWNLAVQID